MNIKLIDLENYVILLLVKNLNEGDGSSLPIIDHSFFRILSKKKIVTDTDNLALLKRLDSLNEMGCIIINKRGNYEITDKGKQGIINNFSYGEMLSSC